jgi:hypothetical protein
MSTNGDVCSRYITPDTGPRAVTQFAPFCALTNEACPSLGLRLIPRADSDDNGEV